MGEIKNSVDRVGFVVTQAEDVKTAVKIAENSVKKLKYNVV